MSFRYTRPTMSSGLGCEFICFSFATGESDSLVRDAQGNTVGSVTRDNDGLYTVQLNEPHSKQLVAMSQPAIRLPASTISVGYGVNVPSDTGYDPDTGEILFETSDATTIVDPPAGTRIEFVGYFRSFNVSDEQLED